MKPELSDYFTLNNPNKPGDIIRVIRPPDGHWEFWPDGAVDDDGCLFTLPGSLTASQASAVGTIVQISGLREGQRSAAVIRFIDLPAMFRGVWIHGGTADDRMSEARAIQQSLFQQVIFHADQGQPVEALIGAIRTRMPPIIHNIPAGASQPTLEPPGGSPCVFTADHLPDWVREPSYLIINLN